MQKRHNGLVIEAYLTAYIGETLVRIYNGEWVGKFYGPKRAMNNFYTIQIKIENFTFNPSHFMAYRLNNREKSQGTFYNYLHGINNRKGLINDIENNR